MSRDITFPTGEAISAPDDTRCLIVRTSGEGSYGPAPWSLQGLSGSLTRKPAFAMRDWSTMNPVENAETKAEMMHVDAAVQGRVTPPVGESWYHDGVQRVVVALSSVPSRSIVLALIVPPTMPGVGRTWASGEADPRWFGNGRAWFWCAVDPSSEFDVLDGGVGSRRAHPRPWSAPPSEPVGGACSLYVAVAPMVCLRDENGSLLWFPRALGGDPCGTILAHPSELLSPDEGWS